MGYQTDAENTWCPGCGNFGILNSMKSAVEELEEKGIDSGSLMISAGIGCHAKIFDYLDLSGLYSIHGREPATVEGMKFANPELKVVAFGGDGDCYGEGLSHLIFAAKRNADITVIVHNNGAYSLTTGQFSPTSEQGFKGPSTPEGSREPPLNPLVLMLASQASFVSRGYSGEMEQLTDLFVEAVEHEGFALVDVLQPCVVFNDTYEKYNELVEKLESPADSREEAMELAQESERVPIGVFYREDRPVYHEELYGDKNPVKERPSEEERNERVNNIIEEG